MMPNQPPMPPPVPTQPPMSQQQAMAPQMMPAQQMDPNQLAQMLMAQGQGQQGQGAVSNMDRQFMQQQNPMMGPGGPNGALRPY